MVRIYKKNAQILKGAHISKNVTSRGKGTQAPRKRCTYFYGPELFRVRRWQLLTGVEPDGGGRDVIILAFICNFYTPKSPKYSIGPLHTVIPILSGLV